MSATIKSKSNFSQNLLFKYHSLFLEGLFTALLVEIKLSLLFSELRTFSTLSLLVLISTFLGSLKIFNGLLFLSTLDLITWGEIITAVVIAEAYHHHCYYWR
ncbi:hypothetical protein HYE36_06540 [Mycoplasmopsis bovis]|nr:hypothetical protein [Mycoplasmopsis bovis]WHL49726.1 hypothetical protein HYE36_06540 [Mycoplasmopsis bovis]